MDLSGRVGRASGQSVRSLRKEKRHCAGRSPDGGSHEPRALYVSASRFLDHGQLLRPSRPKGVDRLRSPWPNVLFVHISAHASWLNQTEIYFSIVQRKVLTPNDFNSLSELEQRLLAFERRYEETASPFQWTFTRKDFDTLVAKIKNKRFAPAA
jgi:hypothetical protein